MKQLLIGVAAAALVPLGFAPLAYADTPVAGQPCQNWYATTQHSSGRTLTCTHLPQSAPGGGSGHLMYWELGGAQGSALSQAPPAHATNPGYKTAPCVAGSSATCNACLLGSQEACAALGNPPPEVGPPPSYYPCGGTGLPPVAGPPTPGSPCRR